VCGAEQDRFDPVDNRVQVERFSNHLEIVPDGERNILAGDRKEQDSAPRRTLPNVFKKPARISTPQAEIEQHYVGQRPLTGQADRIFRCTGGHGIEPSVAQPGHERPPHEWLIIYHQNSRENFRARGGKFPAGTCRSHGIYSGNPLWSGVRASSDP
jgi:hypothetical protein